MAFNRFRPTSHFIAPHSWSNDPCGAVYVPETKEYLICYQWNPGTTEGGNSAWGLARSKDIVTWEDYAPAIRNGVPGSYDSLGVFSGSIVSRMIDDKRVLFLFYTSVSALPIHWSEDYLEGCESQSVAFSKDFGRSWHRYEDNPLLREPPKQSFTTGWRDPFVSPWTSMSTLLGVDQSTDYMMIASGERERGPQLHLYSSSDLLEWKPVSTILDVEDGSKVSPNGYLRFGKNFECASFFTLGKKDYLIAGVEEDLKSTRHSCRYNIWLCGKLVMRNGSPKFEITSHGLLDHGVLYAAHIFRDAEDRLLQLGWVGETAKQHVVRKQGWAGFLTHPRELHQISKPITQLSNDETVWDVDKKTGIMTTLGIRPATQLGGLRPERSSTSLQTFRSIRSTNFEIETTFKNLSGKEKLSVRVRESPDATETTNISFNIRESTIAVDRTHLSLESLGANTLETGPLHLHAGEDLHVRIFVDNSIVEVFANHRFALSTRIYPTLENSNGASYDFGDYEERNVEFEYWEGLRSAWPGRKADEADLQDVSHSASPMESTRLFSATLDPESIIRPLVVYA
jgi:beta-fructofuranosidase